MTRRIRHLLLWGALLALALLLVGSCGGAQSPDDSDEEVIGAPPSETEDPFKVVNTPAKAERADSSGYIGPGEDSVAAKASEATPSDEKKRDRAPEKPGAIQCFSCVRICPLSSSGSDTSPTVDCEGAERDVICGWGVHRKEGKAGKLARAECDGALQMARRMKTWSRIEGSCPPASCRKRSD